MQFVKGAGGSDAIFVKVIAFLLFSLSFSFLFSQGLVVKELLLFVVVVEYSPHRSEGKLISRGVLACSPSSVAEGPPFFAPRPCFLLFVFCCI